MGGAGTDRPSTAMEGSSHHRPPRHARRRARLLVVIVALIGAVLPAGAARADAGAAADDPALLFPVDGPAIRAALDVGAARWGGTPCHHDLTLRWGALAPSINAEARWSSLRLGSKRPDLYLACEVVLNRRVEWDWPKLCTVIVHELGHLWGEDHTADEKDIMFPSYVAPSRDCVLAPVPPTGAGAPRDARRAAPPRVAKRRTSPPRLRRPGRSSRSRK